MAKVAYVPYSDIMAELFDLCGIDITLYTFGNAEGWYETDYQAACAQAWDWLVANGTDEQWEEWEDYVTGDYTLNFWSTDSGNMPH